MQTEIQEILTEHRTGYLATPRVYDPAYAGWNNVLTNLRTLAGQMVDTLNDVDIKVSRGYCSGSGSAAKVPWASVRPYGADDTRTTKTQHGVYVNYIFPADGLECYLVLGLATWNLNRDQIEK